MTNKSKSNIKKTLLQKIGGGNPFRNLKPGSSSSNKNKKIPKTKFVPASYSAETKDEAEEEEGIEHTLGKANDENLYPTKLNTTLRASSYAAGRLSGSSKLSRDDDAVNDPLSLPRYVQYAGNKAKTFKCSAKTDRMQFGCSY